MYLLSLFLFFFLRKSNPFYSSVFNYVSIIKGFHSAHICNNPSQILTSYLSNPFIYSCDKLNKQQFCFIKVKK